MKNYFGMWAAMKIFVCGILLLVATVSHAEDRVKQNIQSTDVGMPGVLTPEQAGKLFLSNAGRFVDDRINSSNTLAGRNFIADFSDGKFRVRHEFHEDAETVTWEILEGFEKGQSGTVPYEAHDIRPGITLIMLQPLPVESLTLIIDDNRGMATGYLGRITDMNSDRPIVLKTVRGPILEAERTQKTTSFGSAADLAGRRFTVVYPNEVAIYEQIYLNEHYVTWHGKKGTSAGVADTERYKAVKIAPDLYLVAWNEKSAPLQISFLFDFERKQELAAFFGYDASKKRPVYQTSSAKISEIVYTKMTQLE